MKQLDLTYQTLNSELAQRSLDAWPRLARRHRQSLRTIDPEVLEEIRRALLVALERMQGDPVHYELAAPPS